MSEIEELYFEIIEKVDEEGTKQLYNKYITPILEKSMDDDIDVEHFITFLHTQAISKEINHAGGWDKDCVGDYMCSVGYVCDDIMWFIENKLDGLSLRLDTCFNYEDEDGDLQTIDTLFEVLNCAAPIMTSGTPLGTYGSLVEFLDDHL